MTPEEKTIIKAEIDSKWAGVGADNVKQYMTAPGSAETEAWVTVPWEDRHVNIHKAVLLAAMTAQERAGLRAALTADADFKMLYEAAEEFTINHPTTIAMINGLVAGIGLRQEAATEILRFGQRLKSRSEELIGRNVTVEEVREALS